MQPDLIGWWIPREWVQRCYPLFARYLGVAWAPPYKDFAHQLAALMKRKRRDTQHGGKRVTDTVYLVPDPAASVVALAEKKRRRAAS
jgi:hypothetical protein